MKIKQHIVFYDSHCGFCNQIIAFLLSIDKEKRIFFSPLDGKTIQKMTIPSSLDTDNTLIFAHPDQAGKEQYFVRGKAVFSILWSIGGIWALPGLLSFLPSFFL